MTFKNIQKSLFMRFWLRAQPETYFVCTIKGYDANKGDDSKRIQSVFLILSKKVPGDLK